MDGKAKSIKKSERKWPPKISTGRGKWKGGEQGGDICIPMADLC